MSFDPFMELGGGGNDKSTASSKPPPSSSSTGDLMGGWDSNIPRNNSASNFPNLTAGSNLASLGGSMGGGLNTAGTNIPRNNSNPGFAMGQQQQQANVVPQVAQQKANDPFAGLGESENL